MRNKRQEYWEAYGGKGKAPPSRPPAEDMFGPDGRDWNDSLGTALDNLCAAMWLVAVAARLVTVAAWWALCGWCDTHRVPGQRLRMWVWRWL